MKARTAFLATFLLTMTAGSWTVADLSAQSPARLTTDTRLGRLRLEEWSLERKLADPQLSAAAKTALEQLLRRVRAQQDAATAQNGVVVVRDTCALPNGSIYRAGDSVSYRDQQYRCADVYDETLNRTGVSWIRVFSQ